LWTSLEPQRARRGRRNFILASGTRAHRDRRLVRASPASRRSQAPCSCAFRGRRRLGLPAPGYTLRARHSARYWSVGHNDMPCWPASRTITCTSAVDAGRTITSLGSARLDHLSRSAGPPVNEDLDVPLHDLQGEVPPEELQQTGLVAGHDEEQPSHVLGCSGFALLTSSRCRSVHRRGLDMSAVAGPLSE